jgi:hypothetical protein
MRKSIFLLLVVIACGDNSTIEVPEIQETSTTTSTTTTTTSTTTTTLASSTSTTTSPVSIVEVQPTISITCEPSMTDDGEYLSFNIKVTKGSNDIEVLNIVSWFDSTRTDDLFISEGLPENEGSSRELNYKVDSNFAKYEIEVLVMDKNENISIDYCLYYTPIQIDYVDIGLLIPLSGDLASLGMNFKLATEYAISEINQVLKSGNIEVRINVEDSSCDTGKVIEAFNELIEENINYIIGPACSPPYIELLNSEIYKNNSNILIISPTAESEELNNIVKISNAYKFCSDQIPPCTINEENISSEFKDSYLKFLDANSTSPLNSLIFEAKFYDATYLATLTALDNYLFGNNSDKKLDIYLDNSNKCSTTRSTTHCVSKILDNTQLDYVGAFGDLKMTNNTLDR